MNMRASGARNSAKRGAVGNARAGEVFERLRHNVEAVILGKSIAVRNAIACLLAEGHLLIEDNPGTGKTSLARALAASFAGTVRRVQFTPDLLPSDITGVNIYHPNTGEFRFRPGPVFSNILIADEINRASPKTQAALLEVMEERQVTVDGESLPVPRPFMVVATQNPLDMHGTYPLPEVQLDRFAMRIGIGYADRATEFDVLRRRQVEPNDLKPVVDADELIEVIEQIRLVTVADPLIDYLTDLVARTRSHPDLRLGVSSRGSLTLLAVARSLAIGQSRTFVTPDDLKELIVPVLSHRIAVTQEAELDGIGETDVLSEIVEAVAVPRGRVTD